MKDISLKDSKELPRAFVALGLNMHTQGVKVQAHDETCSIVFTPFAGECVHGSS